MTDGPASSFRAPLSQREQTEMDRKHVFLINGSPEFLELLRQLLQDECYNVTSTNYVPRTFDQIAALQPDLLLIDLVIQRQAGWELLERLRGEALTAGLPVIVTSTDFRLLEHAQQEQVRYAGDTYLIIPFDLDDLLRAVTDLIGAA